MNKLVRSGVSIAAGMLVVASTIAMPTTASAAAPKPVKYANCTALNKVYPHGVARKGAKDKVTGKTLPVKNFTVNDAVYKLNAASDRDKDGIACEKR